jgi:hypothetical protein
MVICRLPLIRSSPKEWIEGQTEYSVLLYAFYVFHYMCQPNWPSSRYIYIHCPLDSCHYTVASIYNWNLVVTEPCFWHHFCLMVKMFELELKCVFVSVIWIK